MTSAPRLWASGACCTASGVGPLLKGQTRLLSVSSRQASSAIWRRRVPDEYAQEHLAEFVDWSGAAFFSREKLLDQNQPVPNPAICESVFAFIDTASKTGDR
jgi:hypothetical protein